MPPIHMPPVTAPQDRADQLLAMTRRLITLVTAEIAALDARKLDGASADWDEKERLAHAWRIEVAHVKQSPAALEGVAEPTRAALKTAAGELETALEKHALALAAMKEVTEGLVRSIAAEIASVRSAPAAYGRGGIMNQSARHEASGLTVNSKA